MGIEDLQLLVVVRLPFKDLEFTVCPGANPVDTPHPLLHRRWRPRQAVVINARAEQMEILAFLKNIGREEYARIPGHAELPNETLVDSSRHPTDRLLRR